MDVLHEKSGLKTITTRLLVSIMSINKMTFDNHKENLLAQLSLADPDLAEK
ncbi:unnamed protein product, partial [marine sediment metagenome]